MGKPKSPSPAPQDHAEQTEARAQSYVEHALEQFRLMTISGTKTHKELATEALRLIDEKNAEQRHVSLHNNKAVIGVIDQYLKKLGLTAAVSPARRQWSSSTRGGSPTDLTGSASARSGVSGSDGYVSGAGGPSSLVTSPTSASGSASPEPAALAATPTDEAMPTVDASTGTTPTGSARSIPGTPAAGAHDGTAPRVDDDAAAAFTTGTPASDDAGTAQAADLASLGSSPARPRPVVSPSLGDKPAAAAQAGATADESPTSAATVAASASPPADASHVHLADPPPGNPGLAVDPLGYRRGVGSDAVSAGEPAASAAQPAPPQAARTLDDRRAAMYTSAARHLNHVGNGEKEALWSSVNDASQRAVSALTRLHQHYKTPDQPKTRQELVNAANGSIDGLAGFAVDGPVLPHASVRVLIARAIAAERDYLSSQTPSEADKTRVEQAVQALAKVATPPQKDRTLGDAENQAVVGYLNDAADRNTPGAEQALWNLAYQGHPLAIDTCAQRVLLCRPKDLNEAQQQTAAWNLTGLELLLKEVEREAARAQEPIPAYQQAPGGSLTWAQADAEAQVRIQHILEKADTKSAEALEAGKTPEEKAALENEAKALTKQANAEKNALERNFSPLARQLGKLLGITKPGDPAPTEEQLRDAVYHSQDKNDPDRKREPKLSPTQLENLVQTAMAPDGSFAKQQPQAWHAWSEGFRKIKAREKAFGHDKEPLPDFWRAFLEQAASLGFAMVQLLVQTILKAYYDFGQGKESKNESKEGQQPSADVQSGTQRLYEENGDVFFACHATAPNGQPEVIAYNLTANSQNVPEFARIAATNMGYDHTARRILTPEELRNRHAPGAASLGSSPTAGHDRGVRG